MKGYNEITLDHKVKILKQLQVWRKMNNEERSAFKKCQSEYQADRMMRDLRKRYLM